METLFYLFQLYIGEVSSARLRGGLSSINQLFINVGVLIAYLVGLRLSWRWTAILPVMFCAVLVLLMAFMPESPRWLLANNQRHKALLVLALLRGENYDFEEECFEIETSLGECFLIFFPVIVSLFIKGICFNIDFCFV